MDKSKLLWKSIGKETHGDAYDLHAVGSALPRMRLSRDADQVLLLRRQDTFAGRHDELGTVGQSDEEGQGNVSRIVTQTASLTVQTTTISEAHSFGFIMPSSIVAGWSDSPAKHNTSLGSVSINRKSPIVKMPLQQPNTGTMS